MAEYCGRCNRWFRNIIAHYENSRAHIFRCDECGEDFDTESELDEHEEEHRPKWTCEECDEDFNTESDLAEHDVTSHGFCKGCDKFYGTLKSLKMHWQRSTRHVYCYECDRHFQSQSNLDSHLRSSRHQPASVKCPGCNCAFVSPSALTLHLESGSCASGIDYKHVNLRMRQMDHQNIITRPAITNGPGKASNGEVEIWATNASFNYRRGCFECPFPGCAKSFGALPSVNQHLQSGVHAQKEYRCPNPGCGGFVFTRLSALIQHIESEKCNVGKLKQVKEVMSAIQNRGMLLG